MSCVKQRASREDGRGAFLNVLAQKNVFQIAGLVSDLQLGPTGAATLNNRFKSMLEEACPHCHLMMTRGEDLSLHEYQGEISLIHEHCSRRYRGFNPQSVLTLCGRLGIAESIGSSLPHATSAPVKSPKRRRGHTRTKRRPPVAAGGKPR